MTLEFRCQHCRESFGVTKEMFGTMVACPHCQKPNKLERNSEETKSKQDIGKRAKNPSGRGSSERKEIPADVTNDLIPPKKSGEKKSKPLETATPPPFKKVDASAEIKSSTQPPPPPESPTKPPPPPKTDSRQNAPAIAVTKKSKKSKPGKVDVGKIDDTAGEAPSDDVTTKQDDNKTNEQVEKVSREVAIKTLLPPKFLVGGGAARQSATSGMVLVPDSQGGYKEVEDTIARVKMGGREVQLRTYSREELSRRRQFFGIGMFVFCLLVLLFVFYLLNFFG